MCKIGFHKNIAKFHGWIEKPEYIKIVVEHLKGGDVQSYLVPGKLTLKQRIKILLDTAEGLNSIHKNSMMHRDIKAANIGLDKVIKGDELDFTAKIFDFGTAKDSESKGASTHVAGTVKYMAPEQSGGQAYTNKVDIYAFAILAFELIAEKIAWSDKKLKAFNDTRLRQQIPKGLRPDKYEQPSYAEEILNLYKINWDIEPDNRMTSEQVVEYVRKIYEGLN